MAYFDWVAAQERLTNSALTVLVQAINPFDQDELLWPVFFPRQDVPSVKISTITPVIPTRFVADRREWNARGRYIPQEYPSTAELEMVPIESFFRLAEREIQDIEERALGNEELFRRLVGVNIPDRTQVLAFSNLRRSEVDCFDAWAKGTVTSRNPVTGQTATVSYGFDAGRYQAAGVAWTGGDGGTAYNNFLAWLRDAIEEGILIQGVMTRLSTREAIRTSAPNLAFPLTTSVPPLLSDVEKRISDEIGADFRFYLNERHVDVFLTGSQVTTQQKLWPDHTLAVVPAGEVIGYNAHAPVARAFEISRATPEAKIDVNGMVAYTETGNGGRELVVECQVNAFPVPLETKVWVMDAGV